MKTRFTLYAACMLLILSSCQKAVTAIKNGVSKAPSYTFVDHYIAKGTHNSNQDGYRNMSTSEMKFTVRFDNSAMYQTADPANQGDINKLYGFSDNRQDHHTSSARIGWRWFYNQLQLFGYVYNNAVEAHAFITTVAIGQDISCSIRTEGSSYVFTVNDARATMPRAATTSQAEGYLLYPYFGGTEVAPQDIHINIKDI